eukprot:scaffold1748_cov164-Amphora_coffeaeformis.AAC.3
MDITFLNDNGMVGYIDDSQGTHLAFRFLVYANCPYYHTTQRPVPTLHEVATVSCLGVASFLGRLSSKPLLGR